MGEYTTTTSDLYRVVILYPRNGEECLSVISETPQLGMALNRARQLIRDGLIPGQVNIMSLSHNTERWQPLWGSDFDFQTQDRPIFTFF
jgi:hypothetical protein